MAGNHSHRTLSHRTLWPVLLALVAILLLAAALRLWRIDTLPPGFHFDESFEGLEAWRILNDPAYRPIFLTGNFGVTPLNAYANALTFALFQWFGGIPGPTAMRVTAAVFGVLAVLAVYALAGELRRLDPLRLTPIFPLLAAAVLAVLRWHIHFSRMGIEPIFVPLLWAAATWLLLRGWRTGSWLAFAGCGALLAAAMYSYQGSWVIPLLMVPVVVHLWVVRRTIAGQPRRVVPGVFIAAGVAVLLVIPLVLFFAGNLDLLVLRPAQIAVAGPQGAQPAPSAQFAATTPWDNAVASIMMFVPVGQTGDLDPRRNIPGEAALNWWQFLPFAAGCALALWRLRNPAYSVLLVGLAGLILPGVFSEYAPHFHRILGATAPTALLCAVGLDALLRWGWQGSERGRRTPRAWLAAVLVGGLLLAGTLGSARDYFVRWAVLPDLFHAFDTGLWQLGQEIAAQPAGEPVYLTPRPADHPTLAFALATHPEGHRAPISFDGRQIFPLTAAQSSAAERYFVIEPEDFRTRLLLPEVLPNAIVSSTMLDCAGQTYANVYVRPVGETPQRAPQHQVDVTPGDGIRLLGYDIQPAVLHPGDVLYLQLHWLVEEPPAQDWVIFTHLLASDASGGHVRVAGKDDRPGGGSLPTLRWQQGWRILDEYQIRLPADLAPGVYTLAAGLYRIDGEGAQVRLPATGEGILLSEVIVE